MCLVSRHPRGIFSIELAVLSVVVGAALLGMAIYMKRAISGRWRGVADSFGHGKQYDPQLTIIR